MTGFLLVSYLADNYQDALKVRVRPETKQLVLNGYTNNDAERSLEFLPWAKVSGSRSANRNLTRRVQLEYTDRPESPSYGKMRFWLPWLRPDGFDSFVTGTTGTYRGESVTFVKKQDEKLA